MKTIVKEYLTLQALDGLMPSSPVLMLADHVFFAEVKLKEYGLEQVEVTDNGTGIEESNFGSLGKCFNTIE